MNIQTGKVKDVSKQIQKNGTERLDIAVCKGHMVAQQQTGTDGKQQTCKNLQCQTGL